MNDLVPIAALATLLVFVVYGVTLAVAEVSRNVRAARGQQLERELLGARIQRLATPALRTDSQHGDVAWSGVRKFVLQAKVLEGEDTCSFYFAPHDGQPLPLYLPGQYLTFQLQIPGRPRPVTRCYSLSDSPTHPDYYRVTIKRLKADGETRDADGLVSTYLHHQLGTGDLVNVKAPGGHFFLDPDDPSPVVLIGGGIGVTPVLSMLEYITSVGSRRETWFFYGVRDGAQHVMQDYLAELAAEHDNVHLHVCYSHPREWDEKDRHYQHEGRVDVSLLKSLLPSNNYQFYVCGPAGMMDAITSDLSAWGVPKSAIHYEAFGPATVQRVGKSAEQVPMARGLEVEFARSGHTCTWDGTYASLLDFAEANGIVMESGCRAGNCGSCLTAIRSGDVDYVNPPGSVVEEGSCLTCIGIPRGPLVLDA